MRIIILIAIVFSLLTLGSTLGKERLQGHIQWDSEGTRYHEAENMLAVTYGSLQKILDPLAFQKLQIAQNAWEKFKVAECDFKINHSADSPIHPMTYNECIIVMNLDRAVDLQSEIQWQMMLNPFPFN